MTTEREKVENADTEPVILEKIQGQPQVVALLSTHLTAFWNDRQAGRNPSFGPVGLFGPPGVGKTMIAHALHAELGNLKFIECIGENMEHKDSLYATLMEVDENTTLFIDEAQGLPKHAQHILLKVLAENKLCVPKGRFAKKDYQIPLPNFVTVLASTHEYTLQPALLSRIRVYGRMTYYSVEDLAKIVQHRADMLKVKYETPDIFQIIASRAKKIPRLAIRHLDMCYKVSRAEDSDRIRLSDVNRAFEISQTDSLGLDYLEQSYLKLLAESQGLRLNILSARLGLPARTLQDVVEPYLIQEGLISKEGCERIITEKGKTHITSVTL
jgi:Holliday junction DNA helicase RuvB